MGSVEKKHNGPFFIKVCEDLMKTVMERFGGSVLDVQ